VSATVVSLLILFALPWLYRAKTRSWPYLPLFRQFFYIFVAVCLLLGYLGAQPAEGIYITLARLASIYYFAHFLIILPVLNFVEKPKDMPASIADAILPKTEQTAKG